MPRKNKARSNEWMLLLGEPPLTPREESIFEHIVQAYEDGRITSCEAERQFRYFGIPVMKASDLPF